MTTSSATVPTSPSPPTVPTSPFPPTVASTPADVPISAEVAAPAEPRALSPEAARGLFRAGLRAPTSGWCAGWTQINLISVPRRSAYDLLLFAQRNPKPCPVLDVSEPGGTSTELFGGDLRTDLPAYRIYERGELVGEVPDVRDVWREDLVSFLVGCSFTFEAALVEAGVPVRHQEAGTNVPMYRTRLRTRPAGELAGPLVVSMRPVPAALVATAVRVTARYPAVHGAPVHVGSPAEIGIRDLDAPDFGDPAEVRPGDVPVFWACGVTPQAAVMESKPEFAIGHAPGHMGITDARDSAFVVP